MYIVLFDIACEVHDFLTKKEKKGKYISVSEYLAAMVIRLFSCSAKLNLKVKLHTHQIKRKFD